MPRKAGRKRARSAAAVTEAIVEPAEPVEREAIKQLIINDRIAKRYATLGLLAFTASGAVQIAHDVGWARGARDVWGWLASKRDNTSKQIDALKRLVNSSLNHLNSTWL